MEQLKAEELPVNKVFSGDFELRIPRYQRPYSWTTEMALQLLDDLVKHIDNNLSEAATDVKEPYFLGSVVLVKPDSDDPGADVIDGQQRLTTLTILLSVLRDLESNDDRAASLDRHILEPGDPLMDRLPKPRLRLRERDADFFMERIQDRGSTGNLVDDEDAAIDNDSKRALIENARALRSVLAEMLSESPERVGDLQKLIVAKTYLVVVTTPNLESAYRIFSVMNSRGMDLSPADIFKAEVIGAIDQTSHEAADQAGASWEDAEERLGRNNFADLFLHLRMIFAKERAKRELTVEFPEQVLSQFLPDGQKFIDEVLVPYADADDLIRSFSFESATHGTEINRWLERLARLDNNDWRPPALWAVKNRGDDPEWLSEFLRRLERLAASMFVRRVFNTGRATRYGHLLRELVQGDGLACSALELAPDEKAATLKQLDGDIYNLRNVSKPVLLRLDELLTEGSGAKYDHKVISVEHVLPQQPKSDSQWKQNFTKPELDKWTHRLANLVLLSKRKNSEARNLDFAEKKSKYFTTGTGVANFAITTQVLAESTWSPSVLEARQQDLIGRLADEWDLVDQDG